MSENHVVTKTKASDDDLKEINKYTVKELSAEDIYTFSIILCDNDIDRDNERFSVDALQKLCELFVGKTGVFDHDMSAKNQSARIFSCSLEKDGLKKTKTGEDYYYLLAKAYMPLCDKNSDLITEIESGIKKEVSVGCSVRNITCSVCGKDMRARECEHIKGKSYKSGGKNAVAHAVLSDPTDAYEWSFVAVPAQKNAGVIKNFSMEQPEIIAEKIYTAGVALSKSEIENINKLVDDYNEKSEEIYFLKAEIIKDINNILKDSNLKEIFISAAKKMAAEELVTLKSKLKEAEQIENIKPQLRGKKRPLKNTKNQGFII